MALDVTIGGASADSYGTIAEADAWHTAMGRSSWVAGDITLKEAAMRRGAVWLDGLYSALWPGTRVNGRAQARDWPRINAYDIDGVLIDDTTIPTEIQKAQFEAALVEFSAPGSLSPQVSQTSIVKAEKVGPISREYAVSDNQSLRGSLPTVSAVDIVLASILPFGGGVEIPVALVV